MRAGRGAAKRQPSRPFGLLGAHYPRCVTLRILQTPLRPSPSVLSLSQLEMTTFVRLRPPLAPPAPSPPPSDNATALGLPLSRGLPSPSSLPFLPRRHLRQLPFYSGCSLLPGITYKGQIRQYLHIQISTASVDVKCMNKLII